MDERDRTTEWWEEAPPPPSRWGPDGPCPVCFAADARPGYRLCQACADTRVPRATEAVLLAAEVLASWYRRGGNPETERYRILMNDVAHAVEVLREARAAQEREGAE